MLFSGLQNPLLLLFSFTALVIAVTVHEFSHAAVADRLGDPTPRLQGRLTLNPLAHLDPMGTVLMLIARFGWGKPVQFDPFNLENPKRDAALISLAGPASNMVVATAASVVLRILSQPFIPESVVLLFLSLFLFQLITINIVLAIFNLIPIHPLDGFKIVLGLLPSERAREWLQLERYGFIFLIFLIVPLFGNQSPLHIIIDPILNLLFPFFLPSLGAA